MSNNLLVLALASVALCTAAGCSDEDSIIDVGVASESSALQAADVPAGPDAGPGSHQAAHVRIKVKEIRVHVAGSDGAKGQSGDHGPNAAADDTAEGDGNGGGNGWVTVFSGERTIDLDRSVALDSILGSAHASPGKITQVRLILDGQATLVEGATETPIACGSCDTSGLKIIPKGDARLQSGGHHHFVIAFDIDRSLVDEAGQLRLKPVLRLALGS